MQGGKCSIISRFGKRIEINKNENINKIKTENNVCYLDIKKSIKTC